MIFKTANGESSLLRRLLLCYSFNFREEKFEFSFDFLNDTWSDTFPSILYLVIFCFRLTLFCFRRKLKIKLGWKLCYVFFFFAGKCYLYRISSNKLSGFWSFNPIHDRGKRPTTSFPPVTSTNFGFSRKNFWLLVSTLLPHWPKISRPYLVSVPNYWTWTKSTPQKNWFFWSNPYKIDIMMTSVIHMLELPNLGHMTTSWIGLRCIAYWRAVLKRGRDLFQRKRNYSHKTPKLCNFLFQNNKKQLPLSYMALFVPELLVIFMFCTLVL